MYLCNLKLLKSYFLNLQDKYCSKQTYLCTLKPPKIFLFDSNVYMHPQTIQCLLSSLQKCFCTFKPLISYLLEVKCAFAPSNHSKHFFNKKTFNTLKYALLHSTNSYHHLVALVMLLQSIPITYKFAFLHLQYLNS